MRFLCGFLVLTGISLAQSTLGEIRGQLSDPSGAFLTAATIKATRSGTGETRTTKSDGSGSYLVPNLEAGAYEVLVEKSGFRSTLVKAVNLRAREVSRIDITLELAQVATEVKVTDSAQVIQLEMSTVMDSKSGDELNRLPVNYRAGNSNTFYQAIANAPGVQPDSSGNYAIGGTMPFMATASVDGVSNINVRSNGVLREMFPTADSVSEVRISSNSNNAEFAQAGDITITSKSGGNQIHGAAYWYHQNGAFDARDFFAARTPFKVSNDFGGFVGGPVIKNRTFFFGAFEALRFRAQRVINVTVPPVGFRTGNFAPLLPANQLRDPLASNAPFAGNIIPANRISSTSTALMRALYPNPTRAGETIATPNYQRQEGQKNDNDQYDVRIDHNFSGAHRIFGRLSQKDLTQATPLDLFETIGSRTGTQNPINLALAHNWIVSADKLNEIRFGWARQESISTFGMNGQTFDGPGLVRSAGILGIRSDLPKGSQVPDIQINGIRGTGNGRESVTRSRTWQFADNFSWLKGRHSFKFGADIRRLNTTDITSFFTGDDLGTYQFNGQYSGFGMSDFLLGIPNATTLANTGADVDGTTTHTGFYAQDDWRVNRKLTISYGVRYELHPMFFDKALTTSNFDRAFPGPGARVIISNEAARKVTSPAFAASIGNTPIVLAKEAGLPESLRFNDYNNFMPRFGFAYRPFANNKTVIRGGYGIFTATILGSVFYTITGIHVSDARTFPNQLVNGVPALRFPRPFGTGLGALGVPDFRRGTQFDGADPYTQQWNLTIEREVLKDTSFRVSYIGSRSVKLFSSPDLNQVRPNTQGFAAARLARPYPVWNIVYVRDPNTGAWYNGFTTELNRRAAKGLSYQVSYNWAKNLSNATGSDGSGFASENGSVPTDRFYQRLDYGNVPATRRHRFLTTLSYGLPTFKQNRMANLALGGWQLSSILLLQSGPYLTPTTGNVTDPSGTGLNTRANNRPDWTGTSYGNFESGKRTVDAFWDRSAFTVPANNIGRFGNAAPGSLIGPMTRTLSMKIQKTFSVTERVGVQLEGSAANLTNTPNFGNPNGNASVPQFGRITSTQGVENAGARNLQVGLRIIF